MSRTNLIGHEIVDFPAEQFLVRVAEKTLRRHIRERDQAVSINLNDCVRSNFQQMPEAPVRAGFSCEFIDGTFVAQCAGPYLRRDNSAQTASAAFAWFPYYPLTLTLALTSGRCYARIMCAARAIVSDAPNTGYGPVDILEGVVDVRGKSQSF